MNKPLGPYTPAVRAGDFLFCSGQLGLSEGVLVEGGVAAQTKQAVANIVALVESHGAALTDVVKCTCFLLDMDSFATFNDAYVESFGNHRPARSTVAVRELPAGASVEIEVIVYRPL